jgi:hypothetical protein
MIYTTHTKNERLAKIEGREPKAEGQEKVCDPPKSWLEGRMQAGQSRPKPP